MEILFAIGILVLIVIAYQLATLCRIQREKIQREKDVRTENHFDQKIVHFCPTLFFEYRSELRIWFDISDRKKAYYEARKKLVTIDPHSKEEDCWLDIYQRLEEQTSTRSQKWHEHLHELALISDEFFKSSEILLTKVERYFLLYLYWKAHFEKPYDDAIQNFILTSFKETIGRWSQQYGKSENKVFYPTTDE